MGRIRDRVRRGRAHDRPAGAAGSELSWHERAVRSARAHGAMPYVVEGYTEISEAVRRGHSVLLRRQRCEVAEGIVVFDEVGAADIRSALPMSGAARAQQPSTPLVTVVSSDAGTARFVPRDAVGATDSVQLTPRRLERYLSDPERHVGVALGA